MRNIAIHLYLASLLSVVALGLFGVALADISPDGNVQQPIPLVFHLSDGDVPSLIDPLTIEVLFNPKEHTITKATPWKHHDVTSADAPDLEFTSGEPYRIQMELFFDTYEEKTDVRQLTDKLAALAKVDTEKHRPPAIPVTWGTGIQFQAVLESFTIRYTLFLDDGTPVRAVMNCVFKEFSPAQDQLKGKPRH